MSSFNKAMKEFFKYGEKVIKIIARKHPNGTYDMQTIAYCYGNKFAPSWCAEILIREYETANSQLLG